MIKRHEHTRLINVDTKQIEAGGHNTIIYYTFLFRFILFTLKSRLSDIIVMCVCMISILLLYLDRYSKRETYVSHELNKGEMPISYRVLDRE